MKKFLLSAAIIFAACMSLNAQDVKKPRLLVRYFFSSETVSADHAELVRKAVVDALNKSTRFELVDADTKSVAQIEGEDRKDESAMADEKSRQGMISSTANDLIISGDVFSCSVKEEVLESSVYYSCSLIYSVTVTDPATTTTVASKKFEHTPNMLNDLTNTAATPDEAISDAIKKIADDIKRFLSEDMPLEGTIFPMDYEVKKDKLVACYIDLGSGLGVKKGDLFTILQPQSRLGKVIYQEIGTLEVDNVVDATVSLCKVTKGEKELKVAMDSFIQLSEEQQQKNPFKIKQKPESKAKAATKDFFKGFIQ